MSVSHFLHVQPAVEIHDNVKGSRGKVKGCLTALGLILRAARASNVMKIHLMVVKTFH